MGGEIGEVLRAGRLELLPDGREALVDGRPIGFTVRELAVLVALARRADRIVVREQLYEAVWGREMAPGDRSVDVYVSRLRNKLRRALPDWAFIHTHVGVGYRFSPRLVDRGAAPPALRSHAFHINATGG